MHLGRTALLFGLLAIVAVVAVLWTAADSANEGPTYAYSQLLADAAAGRVETIVQDGTRLAVTLSGGEARSVTVASESINVFAEVCAAAGFELGECPIEYSAVAPSAAGQWLGLLITALLPVLLIGTFIYFMTRQAARAKAGH